MAMPIAQHMIPAGKYDPIKSIDGEIEHPLNGIEATRQLVSQAQRKEGLARDVRGCLN